MPANWQPTAGPAVEIKRAKIDAAASGDNTLVAAVAGKSIRPVAILAVAAGAVSVTFYSGPSASGTALSGAIALGTNGGFTAPAAPHPAMAWMATAAGEALVAKLSDAIQLSGVLLYYES